MKRLFSLWILVWGVALIATPIFAEEDFHYEKKTLSAITITTPTATTTSVFEVNPAEFAYIECQINAAEISNTDCDTTITATLQSSADGTNYDSLISYTALTETTGAAATRERKAVLRTTSVFFGRYLRVAFACHATSETTTYTPTVTLIMGKND